MGIVNKGQTFRLIPLVLLVLCCAPHLWAQDEAVVVMTRNSGLSSQIILVDTDIPWNDIRARFQQDFAASAFSGGPGGWIVLISQGTPAVGQTLDAALTVSDAKEKIDAVLARGQVLQEVSFGKGRWLIATSYPLFRQRQTVLTTENFPATEIEAKARGKAYITAIAYGAGGWIVGLTENTGFSDQKILKGSTFPRAEVDGLLKQGYRVTDLARGPEGLVVVMSQGTGWGEQRVLTGSGFPNTGVDSAWGLGFHLTSLSYTPADMLPQISFNNLQIETRLERVADLNSGLWYDEFIKANAGTDYGFVAVQRMAGYYVAQQDWAQAAETYRRYKSLFPGMTKRFDKIIEILEDDNTEGNRIANMGSNINTRAGEFMPLPSADDELLYFTGVSRLGGKGGEDIFVSRHEGNTWAAAQNLKGLVNTNNHEFGTTISADGNRLVLFASRTDGMGGGDLYYADKGVGGFGILQTFPPPINSFFWDCDGFLTSDGKAMIFSSDRPGAVGSYQKKDVLYRGERWGNVDLWITVKTDTGWTKPQNLGTTINTPWAERSPFLHPDGKTLYFCSSGHPGLGKLDVFVTTRLSEDSWTEWSEPVNLGKYINGVGSDWGYRVNTAGDKAYFAAEGLPGSMGGSDIYVQDIPVSMRPNPVATIRGVVTDPDGVPLTAAIKWEDLTTGKNVGELSSDPETGKYFITLPLGKNYGYYAEKEGYYPVSKSVDLRDTDKGVELEVNIVLAPIEQIVEEGMSVRLNNIFFDYDKATLRQESRTELDRFYEVLRKYPNARIEIAGHTDSIASVAYNQDLSQRRAESVVNYLVQKGYPRSNLVAKGYGELKPIADNGSDEGRQMNRRVEFRFLKGEK